MKETNIKNLCCSQIIKYFCAAQKSLLLFCAAHRNKLKYFNAFALLWDDTKSTNCPGRAGFAKARYMKSFSILLLGFITYLPTAVHCVVKKNLVTPIAQ
jgi:hypothetical protein